MGKGRALYAAAVDLSLGLLQAATADVVFTDVADTGNNFFDSLNASPSINAGGTVVFNAGVKNVGGKGPTTGVFIGSGGPNPNVAGPFTIIALANDPNLGFPVATFVGARPGITAGGRCPPWASTPRGTRPSSPAMAPTPPP